MRVSLTGEGLLDPAALASWSHETRQAIRQAITRAMTSELRPIQNAAQVAMQRAFKNPKRGFVRSMKAKVYDRDPMKFPALLVSSKIPWLGLHVTGGTIAPSRKMLIPLLPEHQRIGRKAFKRVIDQLISTGNAFFVQKGDKAILMAENLQDNRRALSRFKRAERGRTGAKSIKRGQEIPIAVLVPTVQIRRSLDLEGAVRGRLPALASAIEREMARL